MVTLTGPRQSGKTTLSKALFPNKPYVSLEDIENRNQASKDFDKNLIQQKLCPFMFQLIWKEMLEK